MCKKSLRRRRPDAQACAAAYVAYLRAKLYLDNVGLQLMVQDYVSEADGSVLHDDPPHGRYHEANTMAEDLLHAHPRSLLQRRVRLLLYRADAV